MEKERRRTGGYCDTGNPPILNYIAHVLLIRDSRPHTHIVTDVMKYDRKSKPEAAGSILAGAFNRMGLNPAIARHRIVNLWPKIVDRVVAAHATAETVSGSTLHVSTDSSVWMNELAAIKTVLLEKINACLPADVPPITDIRFFQRSSRRHGPKKAPSPRSYEPNEKDLEADRRLLESVKDPDLRIVFERILRKDRRLKSLMYPSDDSQ